MALVLADRVQETTTTSGTGTLTLGGAVSGYQSFGSGVGVGNTTYYCIYDQTAQVWEIGLGTVGSGTLARTTVYSNSSGNTSPLTLAGNTSSVFAVYTASKNVSLDASGNVTPLGTIASGTWNGSTVGVAYGGTGVTTSSGASSVVLRDASQNVTANNFLFGYSAVTAAAGTTVLTVSSAYYQRLSGSTTQTFQLPDATTLQNGHAFTFDNDSSGTLTVVDNASATVDTIPSGGYGFIFLESNATSAGSWGKYALLPGTYDFSTSAANFGGATLSNGVWNGTAVAPGYGGTGLTTFTAANYALYSSSASTLTAGTLPAAAGGTGNTTGQAASVANALTIGTGLSGTSYNGSAAVTIANTGVTSLAGTAPVSASASTGGVTVSLAAGYGDTLNPYASKTANYVLAAPNGAAGVPSFRALVAADIPSLSYVTSVSGTSPVVSSGGAAPAISLASGYGDTQNPYASKTANYVLAAPNGIAGAPTFRALVAADIPALSYAPTTGSTSITTLGTIGTGTWQGTSISTTYTDAKVTSATAVAGTGISVTAVTTTGAATHTITNTGVTSATAGTGISVSASTGGVTFTNTGVTSATASTGISVSGSTGGVTFTNTGVTSLAAGNGISVSGSTGGVTITATGATLNSQAGAYVLVASDAGKIVSNTTGGVTINNSVFSAGNIVTIYNNSASSQTITQGTGVTLQWAGQAASTTGNRTLGLYGIATIVFLSASSAVITGSGLT